MPDLFVYLVKVNVALLLFCLGYFLVLRNLTFYTLNRVYLVFAICFATLYPLINLTSFITGHEELAEKVQIVVINWQEPVTEAPAKISKINTSDHVIYQDQIWSYAMLVFWAGVALLLIRLLIRLVSLYRLRAQSTPVIVESFKVRKTAENISPFSFWKSIYLNPDSYPESELKAILAHEQVHVDQWHTLDILLAELAAVFYWFNPGIWLLKKAVRENIEFLTDRMVLQSGYESKAYQYNLLQVNYGVPSNNFVNHFNISTLKKRIIMMNTKSSSRAKLFRYTLLIPVVAILSLVFSISKAELASKLSWKKVAVTSTTNSIAHGTGENEVRRDNDTEIVDLLPKPHTKTLTEGMDTGKNVKQKPVIFLDTTRNGLRISSNLSGNPGSIIYVLNGKLETSGKNILRTIDPDQIASIDIYQNYSNLPYKALPGKRIMLLVTKGSESSPAVKSFKETMSKLKAHTTLSNSNKTSAMANPTDRLSVYPGGKAALNKYLTSNSGPTYRIVDRLPVFPGGQEALNKYLISAIRYPNEAKEKKLEGRVITSFFVEKDGKLTDIKILQDAGGGLGEEAARVLAASPAWIPGSNEGKPMRMNFVMPIVFALDGKIKRMPTQLQIDSAKNPKTYQEMLGMLRKSTNFTMGGFGGADSARQRKPSDMIAFQLKMMGIESPLYYLNGKRSDKDILKRLKANDIETVSIYKEAEATRRYGEIARKGVIIVTSKKI